MKVVHLSYYYGNNTSGAPIAATRLHQALLRRGVESHFICIDQKEEGVNVHQLPSSRLGAILYYILPRACWVLSKILLGKMYMPNLIPLKGFAKTIEEIKPDVVHIHFIGQDMVAFSQLEKLKLKTVITLHDLTLFNAVDSHPCNDNRFVKGFTRQNASWLECWLFNRKRRLIAALKPQLVGPSDWVCLMAKKSLIGKDLKAELVPNIVDPVFVYDEKLRRATDRFTILFGAYGGRASAYKGWPDLVAALKLLPEDIKARTRVKIFGESASAYFESGIPVEFLGAIENPEELRRIHHEADVFALPSRQDNAPQVKFEALLDGLPVIAFARTGCAEAIDHKTNGWVAPDGDIADYAKGLEYYYRLWESGEIEALWPMIADRARVAFAEDEIVRKTLAVYEASRLAK